MLTADLVCYGVFQITLANNNGVTEFNADLIKLFIQTGGKKNPTVFLLTDSQSSTSFQLVSFQISSNKKIRNSYIQPSRETWKSNASNSHQRMLWSSSPSGDEFRVSARIFHALVNHMIIDWFHTWPDAAFYSVTKSFLADCELGGNDPESIIQFITNAHSQVIKISNEYHESESCHNNAPPKSYLELISLFKSIS